MTKKDSKGGGGKQKQRGTGPFSRVRQISNVRRTWLSQKPFTSKSFGKKQMYRKTQKQPQKQRDTTLFTIEEEGEEDDHPTVEDVVDGLLTTADDGVLLTNETTTSNLAASEVTVSGSVVELCTHRPRQNLLGPLYNFFKQMLDSMISSFSQLNKALASKSRRT